MPWKQQRICRIWELWIPKDCESEMRAQPTHCACTQQHAECSVFNIACAVKRFLTCLHVCYWNHTTICIFAIATLPETSSFYANSNYFHNKSCPFWQNPRMIWFQRDPIPTPCHGQGHVWLNQAASCPSNLGLGHLFKSQGQLLKKGTSPLSTELCF